MIARVARFEGVDAEAAESTMAQADAILRPMVEGLAGYAGHLELMAPSGEALSVTFFDSDENAEAAEPVFDEEMPKKLGDLFAEWGGRRASVGRFKVLTDERP